MTDNQYKYLKYMNPKTKLTEYKHDKLEISSFDAYYNKTDDTSSHDNYEMDSCSLNNVPDVNDFKFTPKEKYYYKSIDTFFRNTTEENISIMLDIINGEGQSKISLRLLDWFVTRYANKKKTSYYKNGNYAKDQQMHAHYDIS